MKKEYASPTLVELGSVVKQTLGNASSGIPDGAGSAGGSGGYVS